MAVRAWLETAIPPVFGKEMVEKKPIPKNTEIGFFNLGHGFGIRSLGFKTKNDEPNSSPSFLPTHYSEL